MLVRPLFQPRIRPTFNLAQRVTGNCYALAAGTEKDRAYNVQVGLNGTLAGSTMTWHPTPLGILMPPYFEGLRVYELSANTTGNIVLFKLGDAGDEQAAGVANVKLTFGGLTGDSTTVTWSPGNSRYEAVDATVTARLHAAVGQNESLIMAGT